MKAPLRVGIIGCGDVTGMYLPQSPRFREFEYVACADIDEARAAELAERHQLLALGVEELFASTDIDIVLNLTPPDAHAAVTIAALEAGKHVYSEKPLATTPGDATAILAAGQTSGRVVACSPDTFLGPGLQTAIRLMTDGAIGEPLGLSIWLKHAGPEMYWHPSPRAFYAPGGGPVFDMGPYYLTPLVMALGPVARVSSSTRIGRAERTVRFGKHAGTTFPVRTPTHIASTLHFRSGPIGTLLMSFEIPVQQQGLIVDGSEASISLPDPDTYGGPVLLCRPGESWQEVPLDRGVVPKSRGMGLADMAAAVLEGRAPKADPEVAAHVVSVADAILRSSDSAAAVSVE